MEIQFVQKNCIRRNHEFIHYLVVSRNASTFHSNMSVWPFIKLIKMRLFFTFINGHLVFGFRVIYLFYFHFIFGLNIAVANLDSETIWLRHIIATQM